MNLKRQIGLFGAMMLGLGSIIGTGVFVSIGLGANIAGGGVLLAIFLASLVAICNGLSSAQLAANHPVSGGTYEYGHRWCSARIGFIAGWMFLCAKSASAATAALGIANYLLIALGVETTWLATVGIAVAVIVLLSAVTLSGIRRSSLVNTCVVSITLFALAIFIIGGLVTPVESAMQNSLWASSDWGWGELLQVTALMFVAYTGYGRIATLGEEIVEPRRNIPRAVILTLAVSAAAYLGVGVVVLKFLPAAIGDPISAADQPLSLEQVAKRFSVPGVSIILLVGAVTAMVGVLLNLILGLSRVMLAMGRRGDMPTATAKITAATATPTIATLAVMGIIVAISMLGDIKLAWSFSAFTVLIYYSVTNLCAIRMKSEERLYSVIPSWLGLLACLFLAFWIEAEIWAAGLGLLVLGLGWQLVMQRRNAPATTAR